MKLSLPSRKRAKTPTKPITVAPEWSDYSNTPFPPNDLRVEPPDEYGSSRPNGSTYGSYQGYEATRRPGDHRH